MNYLLDVNAVIALIDPLHVHHERAHAWFQDLEGPWMSTPTTENGVIRVVSNPAYPNSTRNPAPVLDSLMTLRLARSHRFVPDALSLLDIVDYRPQSSGQVTDCYLILTAQSVQGVLATFDRRITTAGPGFADSIFQIP